jgi:putative cell wall-binding protein
MPIKAGYNGNFNSLDMANAIYYAVDHGARVINMSLGGHGYSYTLKAACDYAWEHNVVVVAAAGNDHTNLPEYPAAFNTVISVAATDQNDTDANFSNWGSWIAISAPGVNIYSTTPTYSNPLYLTNYDYSDGTSMSSSIVAGIAGLVLSVKPILTDSQVAGLILTNADDIDTPGYDYYTGFGRVNAYKTLTGAMAPSPTASALPAGGTYTSPQSVTLTASQSGCTIYYTTDGSNPTTASSQYFYTLDGTNPTSNSSVFSQSITISSETVIKYIAVDKYGNQSQIYTQTFNIVPSVNASPIEGVITESTRLAGNDRLSTAVAISQKTFPNSRTADAVLLATGLDFPDALAGASLGKIKNAPLLLVTTYQDSKVTLDEIQRVLKPNGSVYILGGEGVVAPVFVTDLQGRGYNVRRLAGLNRYATAVAIAKEVKVSGGGEVIVATGQNFPDSLSISSYCAANGIPMVLVEQNKVPAEVENYLNTLQPTEITIVGGAGVVSTSVESRLKQLFPRLTTRRFGGIDRFETCVKITQGLFGNNSSLLFVATGIDFPDALAGSVLAGFNNAPIILINPTRLPDAILSYLTQLNHKKVVALGGEGVVSRDVYTKIIGYVQ